MLTFVHRCFCIPSRHGGCQRFSDPWWQWGMAQGGHFPWDHPQVHVAASPAEHTTTSGAPLLMEMWWLHRIFPAGSRQDPPTPCFPFSVLFPTPSGDGCSSCGIQGGIPTRMLQHSPSQASPKAAVNRSPASTLTAGPGKTSPSEKGDETSLILTCLFSVRLTKGSG